MSQLSTHDWNNIVAIERSPHGGPGDVNPGDLVRLKGHSDSLGTCISRRWTDDDKPMQVTVLWTIPPTGFFPNVRAVTPSLIASEIVKVQPMTMPQGGIFYMDYTYGQEVSGSV